MNINVSLPIDTHSPDQLSGLSLELQTYLGELRDWTARSKTGHQSTAPVVSELLATLLRASHVATDDSDALENLQTELDKLLINSPVVHLILATLPSRTLRRQLTVWFRTQVHPAALLTFAVRTDIGGGIIIQAGSRVYDYSFRSKILANKQRIGEIAGV